MTDELFSLGVSKLIDSMFGYAFLLLKNEREGIFYKDIVMEAIECTWNNRGHIDDDINDLRAYWISAIRSRCIDLHRRHLTRNSHNDEYAYIIGDVEKDYVNDGFEYVANNQLLKRLHKKLTGRQKEIYKLRYEYGMSSKDIAAKLNIPYSSARARIHDINNRMKCEYKKIKNKML